MTNLDRLLHRAEEEEANCKLWRKLLLEMRVGLGKKWKTVQENEFGIYSSIFLQKMLQNEFRLSKLPVSSPAVRARSLFYWVGTYFCKSTS